MAKPLNVKPVFRVCILGHNHPHQITMPRFNPFFPSSTQPKHHPTEPSVQPLQTQGLLTCKTAEQKAALATLSLSTFCSRTRTKTPHAPRKARHVLYSTKPQSSRFSWCHHSILIGQHITLNNNILMLFPGHPTLGFAKGSPHCTSTGSVTS